MEVYDYPVAPVTLIFPQSHYSPNVQVRNDLFTGISHLSQFRLKFFQFCLKIN
jgi:hypothetical protein